MKCARCHHENRPGAKFCEECGAPLARTCAHCGSQVSPTAKFCSECADPIATAPASPSRFVSPETYTPKHLAEKILTSKTALEGERKQVTVLFADMKGSMELLAERDPEEAREILDPVLELMMEAVHRYEGTVNQVMGDGIMALFGAPIAHEDHAVRACYAALQMQESIRRYAEGVQRAQGVPMQVRVGLNSGTVVVRSIANDLHMDYSALGQTTHLAARIEQMAMPGSILITADTLRLAEGYVRVKPLGPATIKGMSRPAEVYELTGSGPVRGRMEASARRGLSQFVGRATELQFLREALERTRTGHGELVVIVGEAGMGKSRLLLEFRHSLADREVTCLEAHCLPYGRGIPFLPVLEMLRTNCRLVAGDSPDEMAVKVRASLERLDLDAEEALPFLLRILGVKEGTERLDVLTPEAINARTYEVFWQMSLSGSRRRPLILIIDDVHWIDNASERYVTSLVDSLPGAPILILLTHRPGHRQPWMDKSYASRIALRPLAPSESMIVARSVLRTERLPEPLSQLIVERGEGNPLFLEELARSVQEQGDLRPTPAVPDTIQGVLMARIDRLAEGPKRILQSASVLGREFPSDALRAMSEESETEFVTHLHDLTRLEFLYEHAGEAGPAHSFKHALTQEVAYDSLSTPRRQALHAAAGRALETLYAEQLDEVYDRLAHHYSRTDQADKAVEYLTRLANRSAWAFAHTEAVAAAREALIHAEKLWNERRHPAVFDLVLLQAHSLFLLGRFPEALDLLLRNRERFEWDRDVSRTGRYHLLLANIYNFLGDLESSGQSAQRSLEAAERCGDEVTMGKAHYVLALEGYSSDRPHQGIEHGRQAVNLLERGRERRWLGQAYWALGINHIVVGDFAEALEACAHARAIGDAIEDPRLQKSVSWTVGFIHAVMGECEAAVNACQQGLDASPNPLNTALASGFLGYAYLQMGEAAQAIPVLEEAVARMSQFRLRQNHAWFMAFLSEAHLVEGQTDKALDLARQALDIAGEARFSFGVAWAQRMLGRIACAKGALVEADRKLRQALGTFGAIQARFEMGRTYLDLAELANLQLDPKRAATHAKEAHDLFQALRVPEYVARTRRLSERLGLRLGEDPAG